MNEDTSIPLDDEEPTRVGEAALTPAHLAAQLRETALTLEDLAVPASLGDNVRGAIEEVQGRLALMAFRAFGRRPRARNGDGGRAKLLAHLRANVGAVLQREELKILSGIDEWARRVRELRVEEGYDIEYLGNGGYVLHSAQPDADKAEAWRIAHEIRNLKGASVQAKVERFFEANVGKVVRRDQLDYVANKRKEATRRVRELRDEHGWPILSHIDDPDLQPSEYMLISTDPADRADPNQRYYPEQTRKAVFKRDGFRCRECKRTREDALRQGDTRFILECDHVIGVAEPSRLSDEEKADPQNFQTLCHRCHARKTGQLSVAMKKSPLVAR